MSNTPTRSRPRDRQPRMCALSPSAHWEDLRRRVCGNGSRVIQTRTAELSPLIWRSQGEAKRKQEHLRFACRSFAAVQLVAPSKDGDSTGGSRKCECEHPMQKAPRVAASTARANAGEIARSSPERDQNRGIAKLVKSASPPAVRNPFIARNKTVFNKRGRRPFSVQSGSWLVINR